MSPTRRPRGRGGQRGHEPPARIQARELRVLERSIQGWSQRENAAEERVTQAAISKILRRAEDRMLREFTAVIELQKSRQAVRLEHVYHQGMRAWEVSKSDATRRVQRKTQPGAGGVGATVAELVVETQHGDPRYLDLARKALADLRTLWGLDAPQKLDVRATRSPFDGVSEEGLRAELARQDHLLTATALTAPTPLTPAEETDGAPE